MLSCQCSNFIQNKNSSCHISHCKYYQTILKIQRYHQLNHRIFHFHHTNIFKTSITNITNENIINDKYTTFQIYQHISAKKDNLHDLTSNIIWSSSIYLFFYLIDLYLNKNLSYLKDSNILELGSGTGLISILCCILKANRVYATDKDIKTLQYNIELFMQNYPQYHNIDVIEYNWQDEFNQLDHHIDLIILSDVLYHTDLYPILFKCLFSLITLYQCKLLISQNVRKNQQQIYNFLNNLCNQTNYKWFKLKDSLHLQQIRSKFIELSNPFLEMYIVEKKEK